MNKSGVLYKWSAIVLIIGAGLAVIFLITDCLWGSEVVTNYPQTLEYYPAFIATAGGVLFALILGETMTASNQEKRMKQMQKILRKELERMYVLVQPQKGNHLHTQVWDSLINSGDVSFMPTGPLAEESEKGHAFHEKLKRFLESGKLEGPNNT